MNHEQVIATLRAHERELKQAGIVRLSLFGSTVRGDRTAWAAGGPDRGRNAQAACAEKRRGILTNIGRIEAHTAGMDLTAFIEDHKTYDAVERCLERISEAAKKLGDVAEELCPEVPWPQIRGLENILRHEYDRIEGFRVWYMVEDDLGR